MEERQKLRGQEKLQKEGVRVELHDYGQVHQFSRELGWKTERQQLEQQCRQQEIPELFEQLEVIDQKLRELLQQEQQLVMQEAGEEQTKAETALEQILNRLNCRMKMLEIQKQQYEQRVHEAGEVQAYAPATAPYGPGQYTCLFHFYNTSAPATAPYGPGQYTCLFHFYNTSPPATAPYGPGQYTCLFHFYNTSAPATAPYGPGQYTCLFHFYNTSAPATSLYI
eukprot:gene30177-35161_t